MNPTAQELADKIRSQVDFQISAKTHPAQSYLTECAIEVAQVLAKDRPEFDHTNWHNIGHLRHLLTWHVGKPPVVIG